MPAAHTAGRRSKDLMFVVRRCFFIKSVLKALEAPDEPFLHDVITASGEPEAGTCRNAIASAAAGPGRRSERELVEPDGFEPTTSCLQSTRSTN